MAGRSLLLELQRCQQDKRPRESATVIGVATKLRLIAFAPRNILQNTRDFPGLADLLAGSRGNLSVDTYSTAAAFQAGLADESKGALVTLVSSHGKWVKEKKDKEDKLAFQLYSGREKLQDRQNSLPAIRSNGVVINACNVLDENQTLPPLLQTAVHGRAWTAGRGFVQRQHVVWHAEQLLNRLGQLNSPHDALEAMLEVDSILAARREQYRKNRDYVQPWRDIWSRPTI